MAFPDFGLGASPTVPKPNGPLPPLPSGLSVMVSLAVLARGSGCRLQPTHETISRSEKNNRLVLFIGFSSIGEIFAAQRTAAFGKRIAAKYVPSDLASQH